MIPLPRTLHSGYKGTDVYVVKRALRHWATVRDHPSPMVWPIYDRTYNSAMVTTVARFRWHHDHFPSNGIEFDHNDWSLLYEYVDAFGKSLMRTVHIATPIAAERARMVSLAESQVGIHEYPPDSNRQKYGAWYGADGQSWCAMFVSWCAFYAGLHFHYAYVPYVVSDARAKRNGLSIVTSPAAGDFACYDWTGDGVADHIGILKGAPSGGIVTSIEGNTSLTSDGNGGQVMIRERTTSLVENYVRVSR